MNALTLRGTTAALGLFTALAGSNAAAAGARDVCYDFSGQEVGTAWPIEPQTAVPIGIGTVRVHPLKLDGVVQTPKAARFEVAADAIAGGVAPELSGVAVSIQMLPEPGVRRIRLRYAHQPGAGDVRAAAVEVNGARRDWRGSFEQLDGQHLGPAGRQARISVTPEGPTDGNGWQRGRLEVEIGKPHEIRSFTLGAGFVRLDDVCFRAAGPSD